MKPILVSIIIPVYNVSNYIKQCLNSIIAQDYTYIECLLINDCTPDDSIKKAKQIISSYNGGITFRIIEHKKNKGVSAARNTGIRESQGQYLYCLDSDDEITPSCISSLVMLATKYLGIDIIQGKFDTKPILTYTVSRLNNILKGLPEYSNNYKWIKKTYLADRSIPLYLCNKLIKKEFIIKYNLFNKEGTIWEDMFWSYQAAKHIKDIAFTKEITYIYHIYPTSQSHSKDSFKKMFDAYIVLIKECYENIDLRYPKYQRKFVFNILKERISFIYFNKEKASDFIPKYINLVKDIRFIALKNFYFSDYFSCVFQLIILHISNHNWSHKTSKHIYNAIRYVYRIIIKR